MGVSAAVLVWLIIAMAGRPSPASKGPVVVYVSVPPQASLVREIGGPHVEVHTLVRQGQDPHLFEPSPKQLRSLARARLFLTVGVPFERPVLRKIGGHLPNMEVVDSAAGLQRRPGCACGHDHDDGAKGPDPHAAAHNASDGDPHVWLSPEGLRVIARNTAEALARIDPAHAADYDHRLKKLNASIDEVDVRVRTQLGPYRGRSIYVFHPAFGYFCDAYGLQQKAVEVDGKSPNSRQLRALIHQAKEDRARTIFVQAQFDQHSARAVAQAMGAQIVEVDPLAEDAVANLKRLADAITPELRKE